MKKNYLIGLSALLLVGVMTSCGQKPTPEPTAEPTAQPTGEQTAQPTAQPTVQPTVDPSNPLAGTYDITVWVSELEGVKELTERQIDAFEAANPGVVINATVEGQSEADSATMMITDVESGADLFCFAQDQLARLVQVGALNKLGVQATETVKQLNDAGAIKAASVNNDLYCYPLTSDNGYFMFYDKSVIQESSLGSLEAIIADCEKAERLFSFECETSAWYNASWFFATGCVSEWETDAEGKFLSVNDNFNSDAGLVALKGMQKLLKSPCYNSSSNGSDFAAATPSAVVISGTWASNTVKEALGDNFGAAELPSFEVDGKSYHLGSFSGNKLMGVKPQLDKVKSAVLQKLALWLTNEQSQLERFEEFGWGPSNLAAQANEAVKADIGLAALAAQSPYAIPQGQIHGSWWDIAKTYAVSAKAATSDAELKTALQSYEDAINALFAMSEEDLLKFGVVGGWEGGSWETDTVMEQKPANTYYTTSPILFAEGNEFKIRQGKSWTVNFGANGELNGSNIVIGAEDAGYRFVKMVITEGDAKDPKAVTISLEKYNPSYSWSVIGTAAGTNWDTDFYMTQVGDGVFESDVLALTAGEQYKVRYGTSWDVNYGANGVANGDNIAVEATGNYVVRLTIVGETATIELVPQA